jgi:hypothetical protein
MQRQAGRIPAMLSEFYADPALSRLTSSLQHAMADQIAGGMRDVDGGVKDFKTISVTSTGTQADVKFGALVWIDTEPNGPAAPPASAPQGWWDYDFTFSLTPAGWRVTDWTSDPEPGYEP